MKRPPATQSALIDTTEYAPLFAGLAVPYDEPPASTRPDPSGPPSTWDWTGSLVTDQEETP